MNGNGVSSWTGLIIRAVGTLVIAAVVLSVVERAFWAALPGLMVVLVLVGVCRLALGAFRRDGW